MPRFVPPLRTSQGLSQVAWIRARWAEARSAASLVGLGGLEAMRAAVQAVALWLLETGPSEEWNFNSSGIACRSQRDADDCVNLGAVGADYTAPLAAFPNPQAHAATFWQLVAQESQAAGVNFTAFLGTLDASAAYRFAMAWGDGNAPNWPRVIGAVRTVANAVAVTGWALPDQPNVTPVPFTRSGGGFGSSLGTTVAGGRGTTGRTTTGGTSTGGATGGASGGGTRGGSTTSSGNDQGQPQGQGPRRRSGVGGIALLAVAAVVISAPSKRGGRR